MRISYAVVATDTDTAKRMAFIEDGDCAYLIDGDADADLVEGERVLVRYEPDDQFCRVVSADDVGRMLQALEHGALLVQTLFEQQGRDAYNNDTFCEMKDASGFVRPPEPMVPEPGGRR